MRKNMGVYRGKTKDGDWIEGGYLHQTDFYGDKVDRHFIIDGTDTQDYDIGYEHEVDPETVGEWTGMKDKNGKRIFEGDIIGSMDGHDGYLSCEGYIVGAVFWDDETLSWQVTNRIEAESYEILASDNETLEVIGNIHDNPELVKE